MARSLNASLGQGLILAAFVALSMGVAPSATAGKQAWTQAQVSPGVHNLDRPATVAYRPSGPLPPGAVITQVLADRNFVGNADIQTSVCWNGLETCVDIMGRSLSTQAFNGLDASRPVYLVHRARSWRGSVPPVFIKGNVTVWYRLAP